MVDKPLPIAPLTAPTAVRRGPPEHSRTFTSTPSSREALALRGADARQEGVHDMIETRRTAPLEATLEHPSRFRSKGAEELAFRSSGVLTLGAEIELQLIDPATFNLASRAEEVLNAGAGWQNLQKEFFQSTVEIATSKCADAHEIKRDLEDSFDRIEEIGGKLGLCFSTTGCHPFARYADCRVTPTPRYNELMDRNRWLIQRMTVYGFHIHIGMESGDACIRFNNFFLHLLPHLLALSASSPFWQGDETGLASSRLTTYEALPTAGQPYRVGSWAEFEELYNTLRVCGSIRSIKDLWWDTRPSPVYGTLEIRVCDGLASLDETIAITAFIHGLAHWFRDHSGWLDAVPPPPRWLARENKWRAMRFGLEAELVTALDGSVKPLREDILDWCGRIAGNIEALGYGPYLLTLHKMLEKGNSSSRQRAVFARTGSLRKVVAHNIAESRARRPMWVA
jgi:carboxylate-amine ligase